MEQATTKLMERSRPKPASWRKQAPRETAEHSPLRAADLPNRGMNWQQYASSRLEDFHRQR